MNKLVSYAAAAAVTVTAAAQAQTAATPATPATPATGAAAGAKVAAPDLAQKAAIAAAVEASTRWLALMDAGQAGAAWDASAPLLQKAVGRDAWLDVGKNVRAPLGAAASRKPVAAAYTRGVAGAPPGEYAVIRYQTSFATRAGFETVVPMRQPDGSWKVATYKVQ